MYSLIQQIFIVLLLDTSTGADTEMAVGKKIWISALVSIDTAYSIILLYEAVFSYVHITFCLVCFDFLSLLLV